MSTRWQAGVVVALPPTAAAALAPGAGTRCARLAHEPFAPLLTDLCAIAALVLALWLSVSTVCLLATTVIAPGTALHRLAGRLGPRSWRSAVILVAGATVLGVAPAQASDGRPGVEPPATSLGGLRLPDRPDAPTGAAAPVPRAADRVVVRAGDTLWGIAATSLRSGRTRPSTAEVARACDRWYAANRRVIGPDPDLILPETVLSRPDSHLRPHEGHP